ncbi:MAG: hypothetical protein SFT68_04375 [Rickettsiaceae bacterium]|nr:hypothetical protein [Rickettsiaceae bacterium]
MPEENQGKIFLPLTKEQCNHLQEQLNSQEAESFREQLVRDPSQTTKVSEETMKDNLLGLNEMLDQSLKDWSDSKITFEQSTNTITNGSSNPDASQESEGLSLVIHRSILHHLYTYGDINPDTAITLDEANGLSIKLHKDDIALYKNFPRPQKTDPQSIKQYANETYEGIITKTANGMFKSIDYINNNTFKNQQLRLQNIALWENVRRHDLLRKAAKIEKHLKSTINDKEQQQDIAELNKLYKVYTHLGGLPKAFYKICPIMEKQNNRTQVNFTNDITADKTPASSLPQKQVSKSIDT